MNLKIKSCAGWIWDWLTWFPHLYGSFVQQTCSWMTPRPAWSPRPCLPPVSRCWHQWQQSPGLVISQTPRRISLPAQLNHPTKATPSHPSNLWKESLVGQWKWQLSHSCKWQVTELRVSLLSPGQQGVVGERGLRAPVKTFNVNLGNRPTFSQGVWRVTLATLFI